MILLSSKEPLFASNMRRRGKLIIYFDQHGEMACCNFAAYSNFRQCVFCGNCCVQFIANEDKTYTCSACGKFPREVLLQ
jgi:hypothetical protein